MTIDRSYRKAWAWRSRNGATRKAVLDASGRRCVMCGDAGSDGNGRGLHLAHIVPAPLGSNDPSNLQAMCGSCHRKWDAARAAAVQQCLAANAAASSGGGGLDTPGSTKGPGQGCTDRPMGLHKSGRRIWNFPGGLGRDRSSSRLPFSVASGAARLTTKTIPGAGMATKCELHTRLSGSTMFTSDSRGVFGPSEKSMRRSKRGRPKPRKPAKSEEQPRSISSQGDSL